MQTSITVRKAEKKDLPWIAQAQVDMAKETEGKPLDLNTVTQGAEFIYQHPEHGHYICALEQERLIGCLLVLFEWSDWRAKFVAWIHSVYLIPSARGQGHFKAMHKLMLPIISEQHPIAGVRLYVDKTNTHALEVYRHLGYNNEHYDLCELMFE
jgi:ribosomal protein S18 acetylase RimI-like enzyme